MRLPYKRQKNRAGLCLLLAGALLLGACGAETGEAETASTYAMDTLVTQTAYGPMAQEAMGDVGAALAAYEERLSLFSAEGDIAKINAAAGAEGAEVDPRTAALLRQGLELSAQSEGAFALTIAPVTLAWNITGEGHVVPLEERSALSALVDDSALETNGDHVRLAGAGMGLDLGGIAKGAACSLAAGIYEEYGIESALLSIGGNIYARGTKPGGTPWQVGFRDPERDGESYIASLPLTDNVIAVSGGYERFFESGGVRYIHIFDPRTAAPAESDLVSVGVVDADGATADFWSTTLFVWGKQRALQWLAEGGKAILLDGDHNLYVSAALAEGFELVGGARDTYTLHIVEEAAP